MPEPLFRFGVVSDPQFARLPVTLNRYYERSLGKLAQAAATLNEFDLAFVLSLGDVIDRNWASFDEILDVYRQFKAPVRHVLGNHDFLVGDDHISAVPSRLGMPHRYYEFAGPAGFRFIAVDGTEISTFGTVPGTSDRELAIAALGRMKARGEPNAEDWNGGMSESQFVWLADALHRAEASGERVILLGHFPVLPFSNHAMWDSARLVELIGAEPVVVAYFNGHDHNGNYAEQGGTHFVNFRGMVDTENENPFARVDVYPDRLEIAGYGTEPSRTLSY